MVAEKQVSVRLVAVGGEKLKADFKGIGQEGAQALTQVGRAANSTGPMVQNAAYQVGDFFVQVAGGTSATRAFAQQLPQLLGGFGVIGAVAGAAAAALVPLAGHFLSTGDEAKSADDALKTFGQSLDAYRGYVKTAAADTATLTEEFGRFAAGIKGFSEYMAGVALGKTMDDLRTSIEPLKDELSEVERAARQLADAEEYLASIDRNQYPVQWQDAEDALGVYRDALDDAAAKMGLTADQALRIGDAIGKAGAAQEMDDLAASTGAALSLIEAMFPAGEKLPPALRDAVTALKDMHDQAAAAATETDNLRAQSVDARAAMAALVDMAPQGGWLSGAIADAAALAGTLWDAARGAASARSMEIAENAGLAAQYSQYGQGRVAGERLARESGELYGGKSVLPDAPKRKGGGGGGSANKAQNEALREAERLYDQTRTSAEKYAIEEARIDDLLKKGLITLETHNRAIDQMGEKYLGLTDSQEWFTDQQRDMKDAILDFAATGENSFDQLGEAIKRAALQMLLFGEGPFAGMIGGGFGGILGFLPKLFNFEGGGATPDGPRSGGLDGRGGFLAMLHPRESVIDHVKSPGTPRGAFEQTSVQVVPSPYFDVVVDRRAVNASAPLVMASARAQTRSMGARVQNIQKRGTN